MEETKQDVEFVVGEEVKLDKNGKPIIRDEHGLFPKGVVQPYAFKKGDPRINRKGRPKGESMSAVIDRVLNDGLADGLTKEDIAIDMIRKSHAGDKVATRFIMEFMPKPRTQIEVATPDVFELYDMSKEKGEVPQLEEGGDDDGNDTNEEES